MPLKPAAELPQRHALFHVKVSGVCESGVEHRTDVAVREYEPVAPFPLRPCGVVLQDMEIKRSEDVRHAKGPGRVPAPRRDQRIDDSLTNISRAWFKFFYLIVRKHIGVR